MTRDMRSSGAGARQGPGEAPGAPGGDLGGEEELRCGLPDQHPGALLREVVLPALDLPVAEVARHLGVSRNTLHAILREERPVTPEMAVRLGKLCGNGPGLWARMQAAWDVARATEAMGDELERIPTLRERAA